MTDNRERKEQNVISEKVLKKSDLKQRVGQIVEEVAQETKFEPERLLSESGWWGSEQIGAFHFKGRWQERPAVLKVQGNKPETSEIYMIKSFEEANQSDWIRPPEIYESLPWDDSKEYEALILEDAGDERVVSLPTNREEIDEFFTIYKEYKEKCCDQAWVDKPENSISVETEGQFSKWREISKKMYKEHPYRQEGDEELIDQSVEILKEGYKGAEWEFQHRHLSDGDLYKKDDQIIVLSNLYWSHRPVNYDAVFAYHWYMYHLSDLDNITQQEIEKQRQLWMKGIEETISPESKEEKRLLNLALLERATAGLVLDALSLDIEKEHAQYLVERTRDEVKRLCKILSKKRTLSGYIWSK